MLNVKAIMLTTLLLTLSNNLYALDPPTYSIREIGTLGGDFIEAHDINNNGIVVGASTDASGTRYAFVYSYTDQTMTNLGALTGVSSSAVSVNSSGDVLVEVVDSYGNIIPAIYTSGVLSPIGGTLGVLGTLNGFSLKKINDNGEILASYFDASANVAHTYVRATDGSVSDLASMGINMHGMDINNSGTIVGYIDAEGSDSYGNPKPITNTAIYQAGVMSNILNGFTQATAVNNADVLVGSGKHGAAFDFYYTSAFYIENGYLIEVRGGGAKANDISDSGIIVGQYVRGAGSYPRLAYVYHDDFGFQSLMDHNLYLNGTEVFKRFVEAIAVNNSGQIVGHGPVRTDPGFPSRVFILTPM